MGCGASQQNLPSEGRSDAPRQAAPTNRRPVDPSSRPTRKLQPPSAWEEKQSVTNHELNITRQEFWHTRVEGQKEMWDALKGACDAMISGDIELSNTILEATNISAPDGSLSVCYDELGNEYRIPRHCYSNPTNLVGGGGIDEVVGATQGGDSSVSGLNDASSGPTLVPLRLRVSPGELDITVEGALDGTVAELKLRLDRALRGEEKEQEGHDDKTDESDGGGSGDIATTAAPPRLYANGLPAPRQRMFFGGKEMVDSRTPKSYGVSRDVLVQVYVRAEKVTT